jgi:hypothetical protein
MRRAIADDGESFEENEIIGRGHPPCGPCTAPAFGGSGIGVLTYYPDAAARFGLAERWQRAKPRVILAGTQLLND